VYPVENEQGKVCEIGETPVIGWEVQDGMWTPVPADQRYAEDLQFWMIALNTVGYDDYGTHKGEKEMIETFQKRIDKRRAERERKK
jgi:hypothetical protein